MSKRITGNPQGSSQIQTRKKQLRVPKVEKRKLKDSSNKGEPTQFRSMQNNQNNYVSSEIEQFNIDRLDLIFQKEPKDIQQKLMKLLIAYNAVMHYNKDSDMFQVDLLLPFLTDEQKKQFIRQFLQIRSRKQPANFQHLFDIKEPEEDFKQNNEDLLHGSKQIRKFSFNAYQNRSQAQPYSQQIRPKTNESGLQERNQNQPFNEQNNIIINEIPMHKTGQFKQINLIPISPPFKKDKQLDYQLLDQVIARKLKEAISIINRKKGKQADSDIKNGDQSSKAILVSEETSKQEDSIIDQISNPHSFSNTQQLDSKQLSVSQYIKQQTYPGSQSTYSREDGPQYRKPQQYNYASEHAPYIQIAQQPQEQQYEPLFNQPTPKQTKKSNKNVTSFEDYTKKYTSIKQQKSNKSKTGQKVFNGKSNTNDKKVQNKRNNEVIMAKTYQSTKPQYQNIQNNKYPNKNNYPSERNVFVNIQLEEDKNQSQYHSKRNRAISKDSSNSYTPKKNKGHSPISKESRKLNQQLHDFFSVHRKNLDKFYSQIKHKIQQKGINHNSQSRRSATPQKSLDDLYILVLDDLQPYDDGLESIPEEGQSSQFKQQIIKQYHNQILVNNRNLSSEDLIRYFRFLHTNAKKLYLKYLKNKQK